MDDWRWQALMDSFGVADSLDTYQELVQTYGEPHRHYHTAHHINACLQHFDLVRTEAHAPNEVEMALWFHDACYQPQSHRNEEDSADWARRFLQKGRVAEAQCQRVHDLIMATQHHRDIEDVDAALVVDIDLAILGEKAETFAAFEANIRREYHWVPVADYCYRRSQILTRFLQRPQVYQTPYFQVRYDAIARTNLQQALSNLKNGILPGDPDPP